MNDPEECSKTQKDSPRLPIAHAVTTSGGRSIFVLSYLTGREPVTRISTSLLALCFQPGLDATLETPIRARSRSNGSRSLRMPPLLMAQASIAPYYWLDLSPCE